MPNVHVRHESDSEIRLAHAHLGGWIFGAAGCAAAWLGLSQIDETFGRWLVTGMGVIFALIGFGGALWRHELTLDLLARSYRGRKGFWPSPRALEGSMDELDGVVLERRWRRGEESEHTIWVVSLEFRGWQEPLSLYETTSERRGYAKHEALAKRLRTTAVDRTGTGEVRRSWEELDRPARRDVELHTGSATELPAESKIERTISDGGRQMIVLPALGFSWGAVFLALFGLPFFAMGLLALLAVSGVVDVEFSGSATAAWIVGSVFVVLGSVFMLGSVLGSVAQTVVRAEDDGLVITLRAFGRHYRVRGLPRSEIEEIAVKPSAGSRSRAHDRTEVVLRTDRRVVRIGGELGADEQAWLRGALVRLIR